MQPNAHKQKRVQLWKAVDVEEQKAFIKKKLTTDTKSLKPKERLLHILKKVQELEQCVDEIEQIQRYVYIMYAFLHHAEYGGLKDLEISNLSEIVRALMQTHGIDRGSALSYLYGYFYQILSLIDRHDGHQWKSAWNQQLGAYFIKKPSDVLTAYDRLTFGNRTLRLGAGSGAVKFFESAERSGGGDVSIVERARISLVKSLRLTGDSLSAATSSGEALQNFVLSADARLELEWEKMCAECVINRNPANLIEASTHKNSHYKPTYIIESFFWAAMHEGHDFRQKIAKIRYRAKEKDLGMRTMGFFLDCALTIEDCYETYIPISLRIEKLGDMLQRLSELRSIDRELMVLAASARWLNRVRGWSFAVLVLQRYECINFGLSRGKCADPMGLVSDLLGRPWFKSPDENVPEASGD